MKKRIFRLDVILIIIALSILIGIVLGLIAKKIDKGIYPDDYSEIVEKYSLEFSVPENMIYATIKVESDFDKNACSNAGAIGLMQMLPSTYEWLADRLGESFKESKLYDPDTSIKYGTYYLQYLYARFGSWELASIAYNWGEGNLSSWLSENSYSDGDYEKIPVKETREYVKRINEARKMYSKLYD